MKAILLCCALVTLMFVSINVFASGSSGGGGGGGSQDFSSDALEALEGDIEDAEAEAEGETASNEEAVPGPATTSN